MIDDICESQCHFERQSIAVFKKYARSSTYTSPNQDLCIKKKEKKISYRERR